MKTLVCPIGLGDSIVMSGAAIVLSERYGKLRVPAYRPYMESVKSFYVNHPQISVYPVDNPRIGQHWGRPPIESFAIEGEEISCGHYRDWPRGIDKSFTEWMYDQLGIDYSERWDSCPISDACESVKQIEVEPLKFVHQDLRRQFTILKSITSGAYEPVFSENSILEHAYAIQHAEEIHTIDSSIYHLVESLETTADLYLHRYARCYTPTWFDFPSRKDWTIVTARREDWQIRYGRRAFVSEY